MNLKIVAADADICSNTKGINMNTIPVITLTGRTLLSAGGQGQIRLDTHSLAGGVYLLTCRTASGKSTNHKVIVQH